MKSSAVKLLQHVVVEKWNCWVISIGKNSLHRSLPDFVDSLWIDRSYSFHIQWWKIVVDVCVYYRSELFWYNLHVQSSSFFTFDPLCWWTSSIVVQVESELLIPSSRLPCKHTVQSSTAGVIISYLLNCFLLLSHKPPWWNCYMCVGRPISFLPVAITNVPEL
jgi:hypothetical protein